MHIHLQWMLYLLIVSLATPPVNAALRSIHRLQDSLMGEIKARFTDEKTVYSLRSYDFEESTFFKLFDYDHFMNNLLPTGDIEIRNKAGKTVDGTLLNIHINECMKELMGAKRRKKKQYKLFKVLKQNNFDPKHSSGLIIFQPKKYPYDQFIVKLFFETPHKLVRPFTKDLEQNCLFTMAGGISRYLVGFTRIKNLHYIKQKIEKHPTWSKCIDTPRKWFWLPPDCRWFEVKGYNIGGKKELTTVLPSVYGIIADRIEAERKFSLNNKEDTTLVLSLVRWLGERLDPNIPNYVIEKETKKVVFIDTEHFPTNLGLRKPLNYNSYPVWYFKMVCKYLRDNYFKTKQERLDIIQGRAKPIMECTGPCP